MASITAVAGGGNWNATTTWDTASVPTAADDVFLGASSGNVTINATAVCRSINCTGYTGTLTHNAAINLTIGDATAGASNIALKFVAGMTYTLGDGNTSKILFASTSATQQDIDYAGLTVGSTEFSNTGTWKFTGQYGSSSQPGAHYLTLTKGSLDTNGQTVYCGSIASNNNNTRSLTLGTSTVNCYGASSVRPIYFGGSNFTFSGASSTINLNGIGAVTNTVNFYGAGKTFGTLDFKRQGTFSDNYDYTIGTLKATAPASIGHYVSFYAGKTYTITNLYVTGNSSVNRSLLTTSTIGSSVTLAVTNWYCSNADFQDIAASSSIDLSAITGGSGDAGGNSNITFTTADDWYWYSAGVGAGTYNFSDYTYWYTATNGGGSQMASTRSPLPQDNCIFDADSVSGSTTVDVDMARICKDLNMANVDAINFHINNNAYSVYGSVTLSANVTMGLTNNSLLITTFEGRGSHTITCAGNSFGRVNFNSAGGTYTLQDAFSTSGYLCSITLLIGTLNPNGYNITSAGFSTSGTLTREYQGSTETMTVTSTTNAFSITGTTGLTWSAPAIIYWTNTSSSTTTCALDVLTYNVLKFEPGGTGQVQISGACTFADIEMASAGTKSVRFAKSTTYTMTGTKFFDGNGANLITIVTDTSGTAFTLSKASGTVVCDYLSLQDSTATGGATFYAGANSVNVSGNSGWTFTAPPAGGTAIKDLIGMGIIAFPR